MWRVHQVTTAPVNVCHSSQAFSDEMRIAIGQASARIQSGVTNGPIFARSPVNITSGKTAKGSCRLRITWLRMSSGPVPRSP